MERWPGLPWNTGPASRGILARHAVESAEELLALRRTVSELGAVGRNLNQLARAANQGERVSGPARGDLRALLKVCEGLRDHVKTLLAANIRSWSQGYGEPL